MKGKALTIIIVLILTIAVAGVGSFAMINTIKTIKSRMIVSVESGDLDLAMTANVNWGATTETRNFETESAADSFTNNTWIMPNLQFVVDTFETGTLTINLNNRSVAKAKLVITGLAYDDKIVNLENYRFSTMVKHKIGETGSYNTPIQISATNSTYTVDNIESDSQITVIIEYTLNVKNMNFSVPQNNLKLSFTGGISN